MKYIIISINKRIVYVYFFSLLLYNLKIFNNYIIILIIILIIVIVQLFHIFFISLFNFIKNFTLQLKKNFFIKQILILFKFLGATFIFYRIYINNIELFINFFYKIFLFLIIYCILSFLIIKFIKYLKKKYTIKNLKYKIVNLFNIIVIKNQFRVSNLSESEFNNSEENKDSFIKNDSNSLNENKTSSNNIETIQNNPDLIKQSSNNIELHTHLHAEKVIKTAIEASSKIIETGISQAASQIGLSGSIGAGFAAGASVSAGQNPTTRLGLSIAGGAAGGLIHIGGTAINRSLSKIQTENLNNVSDNKTETPPSPGEGFIKSPNENTFIEYLDENSVEILLACILLLNIINLIFILFLLITVISKLILSLNYKLT